MVDVIAISISAFSLLISSYAIFKSRKDSLSSAITRGLTSANRNLRNPSGRNISSKGELSKQERRELIAERSRDSEIIASVKHNIEVLKVASGHIPPDYEAQTNLPAFRARYTKRQVPPWQTPEGR